METTPELAGAQTRRVTCWLPPQGSWQLSLASPSCQGLPHHFHPQPLALVCPSSVHSLPCPWAWHDLVVPGLLTLQNPVQAAHPLRCPQTAQRAFFGPSEIARR